MLVSSVLTEKNVTFRSFLMLIFAYIFTQKHHLIGMSQTAFHSKMLRLQDLLTCTQLYIAGLDRKNQTTFTKTSQIFSSRIMTDEIE